MHPRTLPAEFSPGDFLKAEEGGAGPAYPAWKAALLAGEPWAAADACIADEGVDAEAAKLARAPLKRWVAMCGGEREIEGDGHEQS